MNSQVLLPLQRALVSPDTPLPLPGRGNCEATLVYVSSRVPFDEPADPSQAILIIPGLIEVESNAEEDIVMAEEDSMDPNDVLEDARPFTPDSFHSVPSHSASPTPAAPTAPPTSANPNLVSQGTEANRKEAARLKNSQNQLLQDNEELRLREEDVAKRKEDVAKRKEDVAKRKENVAKREEDVAQRENIVRQRKTRVKERRAALTQREADLKRREDELARRKADRALRENQSRQHQTATRSELPSTSTDLDMLRTILDRVQPENALTVSNIIHQHFHRPMFERLAAYERESVKGYRARPTTCFGASSRRDTYEAREQTATTSHPSIPSSAIA